ncbi:hypothetical protein HPC49_11045, partial [Pyxidicoccus fallax]|nr:hypothetical protein [Pyxidicoccus fallax]
TSSTTTSYDATKSPPLLKSRTEEVRMERPPPELARRPGTPQGPATVRSETQYNAQGIPTKKVQTTEVHTPGYDAKAVSDFEAAQGNALQNASKGADHHKANNPATSLKQGGSSLTITEETRYNAQGEPAVSTQKTDSVELKAAPKDKNGNGVQVVRSQQEVTRGPKDAVSTDSLPAVSSKTPGTVTSRTTATSYDPDGSTFQGGHASRTQTVSQASGTVDAQGQLQLKHQPMEVKSLQEASKNRWKYDHVGFQVDGNGKPVKGQEPKRLDKERQLPWHEDLKDFALDGLSELADTAGDLAGDALSFAKDVVLKPVDAAIDQLTAPLEGKLADEIKKLDSAGDTLTLSGNLDVKVGLKAGIEGEVEIEKTADGKYQLSAEVTADVGVGLLGSASGSAGGRMEMTFDTPEEAAKAAVILGKGPAALASGGEDHKFLLSHLSAMEVNVGAEAEAGFGGKFGPSGAELSASIGATMSYRVEFENGKPTHLVRTMELEGSGAANIAAGFKDKAGLDLGGEVSGSVSVETKIPLDASKVDAKDMLAFMASPTTAMFSGPAETTISVEGSVDAGTQGRFFSAEISGLSGEEMQDVTKKLLEGKFANAFDDVDVKAEVTTGSFKDRELAVGAKLGVVDFELSGRHRDVTAEGANGNGGTTVDLGGSKKNKGNDGSSGSSGSKPSGSNGTSGGNKPSGSNGTSGSDKPTGSTGTTGGTTPASRPGGRPATGDARQPGTTTGQEQAARPPASPPSNRLPPNEFRVNPATGQLIPTARPQGPRTEQPGTAPTRPTLPEQGTDNTGRPPVPVVRNPELPGRTTHVRYDDGRVRIEAGPDATPEDIQAHMETARVLQRYEGAVGKVRQLIDKVKQALTGMPGYGTQGFESRLEVQKLNNILKSLQATQAQLDSDIRGATGANTPRTDAQRAELERRIASVENQLRTHAAQVDSLARGNGYVAEHDDRTPPTTANGRPLPGSVQNAVNTAWHNLERPEDRQRLQTLLDSEGFSRLAPREQEVLFRLVGGTNPQLSQPMRDALFNNVDRGYLESDEFNGADDQARFLRSFLANEGTAVRPGMPMKVPTVEGTYDSRRLDVSWTPEKSDPTFPTEHVVMVDGKAIKVKMGPTKNLPEGLHLPDISEVANAIAALPAWARESITSVETTENRHPMDKKKAKETGRDDFRTFMAADANGRVTIHPVEDRRSQDQIDGTLVHELAHTVSKKAWRTAKDWESWNQAMKQDLMVPSHYARDDFQEDFSEAVKLYDQVRGTPHEAELRAMMPNRFALLDQFFKDKNW